MIKKLDLLIIRAFIPPFIATFLVCTFVLILQFFWLWIDEYVGKGLDLGTIGQLVMLIAASTVPLALPLAILLSSIMTFGNLGESFELIAIKSAGISLNRFMRPILVVSLIITGIAFLFANNIIPVANLKLNRLQHDIVYSKPAFDIKEGVFYDKIDNFIIKVGSKEKEGGGISNVIVYERNGAYLQDNLIVAEKGTMKVSEDKRSLEFHLQNGTRYEERGMRNSTNTEFFRVHFKEYKKIFDLSSFFKMPTSDSLFKDNWKMLTVSQLNKNEDSLKKQLNDIKKKIANDMPAYFKFSKHFDSGWIKKTAAYTKPIKSFKSLIPDSCLNVSIDQAVSAATNAKSNMEIFFSSYNDKAKVIRLFGIEWHRKFSLSAACLVLFLIGAPLGSIIRKGGIGMPLVFAVVFFMIFFMLSTIGEKSAKEGVMSPIVGMWLATLILLPIAAFLIYKAMRDSQLFNKEYYYRTINTFRKYIKSKKKQYEKA